MARKKFDPIVVLIDSIIGYFIFLVFVGNTFQIITDPLITNNLKQILITSILFVILWWIYAIIFKNRTNLF